MYRSCRIQKSAWIVVTVACLLGPSSANGAWPGCMDQCGTKVHFFFTAPSGPYGRQIKKDVPRGTCLSGPPHGIYGYYPPVWQQWPIENPPGSQIEPYSQPEMSHEPVSPYEAVPELPLPRGAAPKPSPADRSSLPSDPAALQRPHEPESTLPSQGRTALHTPIHRRQNEPGQIRRDLDQMQTPVAPLTPKTSTSSAPPVQLVPSSPRRQPHLVIEPATPAQQLSGHVDEAAPNRTPPVHPQKVVKKRVAMPQFEARPADREPTAVSSTAIGPTRDLPSTSDPMSSLREPQIRIRVQQREIAEPTLHALAKQPAARTIRGATSPVPPPATVRSIELGPNSHGPLAVESVPVAPPGVSTPTLELSPKSRVTVDRVPSNPMVAKSPNLGPLPPTVVSPALPERTKVKPPRSEFAAPESMTPLPRTKTVLVLASPRRLPIDTTTTMQSETEHQGSSIGRPNPLRLRATVAQSAVAQNTVAQNTPERSSVPATAPAQDSIIVAPGDPKSNNAIPAAPQVVDNGETAPSETFAGGSSQAVRLTPSNPLRTEQSPRSHQILARTTGRPA